MNNRPHPGLLPQEKEKRSPRLGEVDASGGCEIFSAKEKATATTRRTSKLSSDAHLFSLSPKERAGVRASVKTIFSSALLFLFAFVSPLRAQNTITNFISPVVSYQYYDALGTDTNSQIISPSVSYQFYDSLEHAGTNSQIISPVASYQYFDWPDASSVRFINSPSVSYYYQFGNANGPVVLHGRVTDTNGVPLPGATVSAMVYLTPVGQANTDANGNYQMPSLAAGVYDLSAWDATHQTSMRALTFNANTAQQNFQLKPLPSLPATQQVNRSATFQFPPIGSLGETLKIFNGSVFVNISPANAPSPSLMTIVLTHGWNSDPTVWAQRMASNMVAEGVSANVLAYDWQHAADSPYPPEANTPAEGVLLGQSLQTQLGANYSHPIHFIGHSLGTIVNASAANYLHGDHTAQQGVSPTPWMNAPIHVTLLDEAEASSLLGGVETFFDGLTVRLINLGVPLASPPSGASVGWKSPIPIHFTWADNYISKFGFYHSDAVNVRLDKATFLIAGAVAQHAYSYQWYGISVTNPADCVLGFQRSYEARNANLSAFNFPPSTTDFPAGVLYVQSLVASDQLALIFQPTLSQTLGSLANNVVQGITATVQVVGNVTATIQNAAQNAAQSVAQGFDYVGGVAAQGGQAVVNFFDSAVLRLRLHTTPAPSPGFKASHGGPQPQDADGNAGLAPMAWLPIQFPSNATAMAFDFTVEGNPMGDVLVCGVGTNNLFSLEAKYIPTNTASASRLIDVSQWAGTTNELFFGFMGGTSTNATLQIENIRFYSLQSPQLAITQTGNGILLAWPSSAGGYSVQSTTNLTSPAWDTVTNVPAISGSYYVLTNSWPDQVRFFRLQEQ